MDLFRLKNVSKRYRLGATEVVAIDQIDMKVKRGEFLVIWGPSGCGKSTLLNLLATIDQPDAGHLEFDGRDLAKFGDVALTTLRQKEIGVIFQSFNLVPVLSAIENVMLPLQLQGGKPAQIRSEAERLMQEVGVAAYANQRPDQLSGGQRQRVAIARALIAKPKVVIADEPTANLDSENTRKIIDLMLELNRQHGVTFVFSTHDPLLLSAAERKVQLLDGRIVKTQEDQAHVDDISFQKFVA